MGDKPLFTLFFQASQYRLGFGFFQYRANPHPVHRLATASLNLFQEGLVGTITQLIAQALGLGLIGKTTDLDHPCLKLLFHNCGRVKIGC